MHDDFHKINFYTLCIRITYYVCITQYNILFFIYSSIRIVSTTYSLGGRATYLNDFTFVKYFLCFIVRKDTSVDYIIINGFVIWTAGNCAQVPIFIWFHDEHRYGEINNKEIHICRRKKHTWRTGLNWKIKREVENEKKKNSRQNGTQNTKYPFYHEACDIGMPAYCIPRSPKTEKNIQHTILLRMCDASFWNLSFW